MFALLKLFFVFILIALFVAVIIVVAFVGNVVSLFRKVKKQPDNKGGFGYGRDDSYTQESESTFRSTGTHTAGQKRKIIPQDEGEYVDFEEVE